MINKSIYTVSALIIVVVFLQITTRSSAALSAEQQQPDVKKITATLERIVQMKKFDAFKRYVLNQKMLNWTACDAGDIEPEKLSLEEMIQRLSRISKGADIHIYNQPVIHLWIE